MIPTRERDRLERQQFENEFRDEQKRLEEERLRPIRELEAKITESAREIAERERIGVQLGLKDEWFELSPQLRKMKSLPLIEAIQYTKRATDKFLQATPEFYRCPENSQSLLDYLVANGVEAYVDAETFQRAYQRLRFLRLLKEKPDTQPTTHTPTPNRPNESAGEAEAGPPNLTRGSRTTSRPQQLETWEGRDPSTGQARVYTEREIDGMSSDHYRRVFIGIQPGLKSSELILKKRVW
jgi:hypothetical protein